MIRVPGYDQLNVPITFPAVLSKSRDYNAIELLFTSIFNYFYILSKESKNVHNPKRCRAELLPLLAQYYRYEYTNVEDVAMEREIIGSVPELHHNKGIATGINNALALCKVDKTDEVTIPWFYDRETNIVTVIIFDGLKTYKMFELLQLVIPLGTKIVFKPGYSVRASEEVQFHSWIEINYGELDPDKQWYVSPNNTFKTVWDPEKQLYHTYIDEQYKLDAARTGNIEVAHNDTTVPDENNSEN